MVVIQHNKQKMTIASFNAKQVRVLSLLWRRNWNKCSALCNSKVNLKVKIILYLEKNILL